MVLDKICFDQFGFVDFLDEFGKNLERQIWYNFDKIKMDLDKIKTWLSWGRNWGQGQEVQSEQRLMMRNENLHDVYLHHQIFCSFSIIWNCQYIYWLDVHVLDCRICNADSPTINFTALLSLLPEAVWFLNPSYCGWLFGGENVWLLGGESLGGENLCGGLFVVVEPPMNQHHW